MKYALATLGLLVLSAGCTVTDNPLLTSPQSVASNVNFAVPAAVRGPQGHVLLGHVVGRGVGVFTAQINPADPNKTIWVLASDEGGDLLDENNAVIGRHQANSWAIHDGGQVTGERIASVWLPNRAPIELFQAVSHEGGGLMGSAMYIQRVHNLGGPPAAMQNAKPGTQFRAEYSADFYFYDSIAEQTRANRGGAYVGG